MKVFLSHQNADSVLASQIAQRLWTHHQIESYLDVIDPYLNDPAKDLAAHIRSEMGKCTQLLAVISQATRQSQWVPWEIGVATEKDFPLATYSAGLAPPPEFLQRWPYLRSNTDLDAYAAASKAAGRAFTVNRQIGLPEATARSRSTRDFFHSLRTSLRQ